MTRVTSPLLAAVVAGSWVLTPSGGVVAQVGAGPDGAAVYAARCAVCHDGAGVGRAPSLSTLEQLPVGAIVLALEEGVMRQQGSLLSPEERRAVAEHVSRVGGAPGAPAGAVGALGNAAGSAGAAAGGAARIASAGGAAGSAAGTAAGNATAGGAGGAGNDPASGGASAQTGARNAAAAAPAPPPVANAFCDADAGASRPTRGPTGGAPAGTSFGGGSWTTWGANLRNDRHQPAAAAGMSAADVPRLTLRWAFVFSRPNVRSQPAVADGHVFVGSPDGTIYALDARTGCIAWEFSAPGGAARAGLVVGDPDPTDGAATATVFYGDGGARVYSLDARTGALNWRVEVGDHPTATLTGTPVLHAGRLYVPVSSGEVAAALRPDYECCTFRGSLVALDARTGEVVWRYFTIDEEATPTGASPAGVQMLGPSGAPVWSTPTIDERRGLVYIGVGENYTHPWTSTSDAVHAVDLETGARAWVYQATSADVWNMACTIDPPGPNCASDRGPDHDFGMSPMLVTLPGGREILVAGQKSGIVHALDPDRGGALIWRTRVGSGGTLGGIHWGMAADGAMVFAPVSDRVYGGDVPTEPRPGLVGIDAETGRVVWSAPAAPGACEDRQGCFPGYSAPPTSIPGVVFAGALDGHIRAFASSDGTLLWEFDAAREFQGLNGGTGTGGSFDVSGPVVADGMVYVMSGYGGFGQIPGNVLLVFGLAE